MSCYNHRNFRHTHKMWPCVSDIAAPHSVWVRGERWLAPGEKPSLACRWPQLCHIGTCSVLLWLALPCADLAKPCSCDEPHSRSAPLALWCSVPHTNTSEQALRLQGHISSSVNSEENKLPSESNIWHTSNGTHLLGSKWYSLINGPRVWMISTFVWAQGEITWRSNTGNQTQNLAG